MSLKIGVALGSGSARGWAHIGVLKRLEEKGIKPDIVTGTSIGSLVGAACAMGVLGEFEAWVRTLEWRDVVGFLDISLDGGLIKGKKLFDFFKSNYPQNLIEDLGIPYGAVATDLETGTEVWLRNGTVLEAVRASISLPGLFTPVYRNGRILVDGGLVNPVPVSLCRAMGADIVIAVDLNVDLLTKKKDDAVEVKIRKEIKKTQAPASVSTRDSAFWIEAKQFLTGKFWGREIKEKLKGVENEKPSIVEVVSKSINVMQARITRSRMAGDPPDFLIGPRLRHIGLMEYHRADEVIAEGRRSVDKVDLEYIIENYRNQT